MEWARLLQLFLPLLIKLLQGIATLPPEAQQHMLQALIALGPEDSAFSAFAPQQQGGTMHAGESGSLHEQASQQNANVGRET